jgi:GAF domain-containing protein
MEASFFRIPRSTAQKIIVSKCLTNPIHSLNMLKKGSLGNCSQDEGLGEELRHRVRRRDPIRSYTCGRYLSSRSSDTHCTSLNPPHPYEAHRLTKSVFWEKG